MTGRERMAGATLAAECEPGSDALCVADGAPLIDAVDLFSRNPDLRMLPVIDHQSRPLGAIFEKDLRRLLFSPYGYALMRNPGLAMTIAGYVKGCPTVEISAPVGDALDLYARSGGREGMMLTDGGRLAGVIVNRKLIALAGRREAARADRLAAMAESFERDAAELAGTLAEVSTSLRQSSAATMERAASNGEQASIVAAAAAQANDGVAAMADQCAAVAGALDRLHAETAAARHAADSAVEMVTLGTERTRSLRAAADSIAGVVDQIQKIVGAVRMLAVNANIEAARAGDAGRGFAVVAREVQSLAGQTRELAESIARDTIAIRRAVDDVASGHTGMADVIARVEEIARNVDATVAAQRDLTRRVADTAGEAAGAHREICRSIETIGRAAAEASTASGQMQRRAEELGDQASALQSRVTRFTDDVRAA